MHWSCGRKEWLKRTAVHAEAQVNAGSHLQSGHDMTCKCTATQASSSACRGALLHRHQPPCAGKVRSK